MSSFDKDTWATPQYIYNWLNLIYNFEIDLCANKENKKCGEYFSIEQDSLSCNWRGFGKKTGFCNPPYSNISPWIDKAIEEARNGFITVMLIETPNGQSHYKEVFEHATSITFINGRLAFYNPHLKKHVSGNTRGSCIVEFSKKYDRDTLHIKHVDRDELKGVYSNAAT